MSNHKAEDPKTEEPTKKFKLLPLSLCIETLGGIATKMILRGTPLPAKRSQVFSTASDNQEEVEVLVLMGESPIARKNLVVGTFRLMGIPTAPKGVPQIAVTFEVDPQCKVKVYATEKASLEQIEAELSETQPDLSNATIERLLRQAELDRDEDQRFIRSIDARNSAEHLIREAEKHISQQQGMGYQNEQTRNIESALAELGLNLESDDLDGITQSSNRLRDLLVESGTILPRWADTSFPDFWESIFGGTQQAPAVAKSPSDDMFSSIFGASSNPARRPSASPKKQAESTGAPSRKETRPNVVDKTNQKPTQDRHTPILAVFANPRGSDTLRLGAEDRVIRECLRLSKYRDRVSLDVLHAATIHDVRRAMLEKEYRIVQFSGHGTGYGLAFEDEQGKMRLVPQKALAEFLSAYSPPIECVILNACYSNLQGQLIAAEVPYVIGMGGAISDEGATEFTRGFYDALGAGKGIEFAYAEGCRTIKLMGLPDGYIPVIFKRRAV
jgi:hypothetical protein